MNNFELSDVVADGVDLGDSYLSSIIVDAGKYLPADAQGSSLRWR